MLLVVKLVVCDVVGGVLLVDGGVGNLDPVEVVPMELKLFC